MTTSEWISDWKHKEDGTPCDAGFQAPRPVPMAVSSNWWCTEHGMHLVVRDDGPRALLASFVDYETSVRQVMDQIKIALVNDDMTAACACMEMLSTSHARITERMKEAAQQLDKP